MKFYPYAYRGKQHSPHSDHLAFFRLTQGTRLGSKRMKNARFKQYMAEDSKKYGTT